MSMAQHSPLAQDIRVADVLSGKSGSDENFPVASALIAPRHRPAILGFYRFVRAADDIADHATLPPAVKHALLDRLEAGLLGTGPDESEATPLRRALAERGMEPRHALDMLVAFRRDVDKAQTFDWADLLDYCRYSAAPVGRFVLDLHGETEALWPANDALCTALQIINHLQDCARDYRDMQRIYLPLDLMQQHGVVAEDLVRASLTPGLRAVLDTLVEGTLDLLKVSATFAPGIADLRLALEVGVIQRVAETLTPMLAAQDPLATRVALGKAGYARAALSGAFFTAIGRLSGRRRLPAPQEPMR